ncbi:hypothetical protein MMC25_000807 [Agyrium rufum]|nr:hypothetical protein [Agyrium rufum]
MSECTGEPTYEAVKRMKYLKYVINETLRVHTLFFTGLRTCLKDSVLPMGGGPGGTSPIFVKKGQIVAFDMWSFHKDKGFWGKNAEEFVPERWEFARPTWEYLPFNGGPRVCLAQQLVLVETSYMIIRLMQKFANLESRDDRPWEECLKLSVRSKHGVKVGLLPALIGRRLTFVYRHTSYM